MSRKTIEIPVECLATGMYVAHLDRPWIETPFLFQGFRIERAEEIAELTRLCKVVGVDVTEPEAQAAVRRALAAAPAPLAGTAAPAPRPVNLPSHAGAPEAKLRRPIDPVALTAEIKAAKGVHADAKKVVMEVMTQLRAGRKLTVPSMAAVVDSMVESVLRNSDAMMLLNRLRTKDDYLYSHSLGSSVCALALGRHLNLDKDALRTLGLGAMLLDVGKTRVSTELLQKPEELSDAERAELRRHVEYGLDVVRETPGMSAEVLAMIETHHERFDGSGYPRGLAGEDIPLVGRIAAIVDSYDAMISVRNYSSAVSSFEAVRELKRMAGTHYQAELVEQLIQAVGVFPTGTLVELNTGEVGVVIGQSPFRRLKPEIMLVLDRDKRLREEFATVDLQKEEGGSSAPALWITRGLEPGAYGIDPAEYFL